MVKRQKRANKARMTKSYEFHLAFEEVNGSVGKLVTGSTRVTQRFNGMAHTPDVSAKAVESPYSKSANDNPYEARMSAIEQLLHKAKSGDSIHIFTADERVHEIASDDPNVSCAVREKFKSYAARDINIDVNDISVLEDDEYIKIADRMARIRANNLQNPDSGARGYHR